VPCGSGDICLLDADGQDDVVEIPCCWRRWRRGGDGDRSRFAGTLVEGSITCSTGLATASSPTSSTACTDPPSATRKPDFVRASDSIDPDQLARAYEIETEMLIHVLHRGGRVAVPVTRYPRRAGATSRIRCITGFEFSVMLPTG
jgi:hypothetical protein